MVLNPYFSNYSYPQEQDLLQDSIVELIQMYGYEVKYLPHTAVAIDPVFNEDTLWKYDTAASIEAYVKNVEGFEGEGDILGMFGLQIKDQITFTIARKRWEQIRTEKILVEEGGVYLSEDSDEWSPEEQTWLQLEAGNGDAYTITTEMPVEGDVIYFPLVKKLFRIEFVEHENLFYPLGRLLTFDLKCTLLEYSSERFDTGIPAIDEIEDQFTLDSTQHKLLMEDGSSYLTEDGYYYIIDDASITEQDTQSDNEMFNTEAPGVLDWSEHNPFSENRKF